MKDSATTVTISIAVVVDRGAYAALVHASGAVVVLAVADLLGAGVGQRVVVVGEFELGRMAAAVHRVGPAEGQPRALGHHEGEAVFVAGALRVALGVALFLLAPETRAPELVRVIGLLSIVAGVVTASLGQARNNLYLAVKTWAAYVCLRKILDDFGLDAQAREAAAAGPPQGSSQGSSQGAAQGRARGARASRQWRGCRGRRSVRCPGRPGRVAARRPRRVRQP